MFRRLALGAAASLVSAAVTAVPVLTPSAASAVTPGGSLVYIKGGNVWLSAPDGSGQRQVSTGGGFSSPSMSDDGTIAALKGDDLVVMKANGTRIAQRELPDLFFEGSCSTLHITPPLEAVISPDGDHVAWSQLRTSSCNGRLVIDDLTAITETGRATLGGPYLGYDPAWIGNGKIVVDDEAVMHLVPLGHDEPKGISWFDSYDLWGTYSFDLNTPAVSRDGSRVAYLADRDPELLHDHATTGNPVTTNQPGVPSTTDVCSAQAGAPRPDEGPLLDDLMFSPDGDALVHLEGDEVWVIGGVGGRCEARTFDRVLSGVEDVSWSAATPSTEPEPDRTAPTASVTRVQVRHAKRSAVVTFRGADDTTSADALRFRCQVDRSAKVACSSPAVVRKLKPGRHTVRVWAVDRAGNTSAPASKRFQVRR